MNLSICRLIVFSFLFFISCALNGQLSNRIHEQIRFKYITVDEGLNNNRVRGLAKDNYGFIWIGTSKGVARFDGYSVINYDKYKTDTAVVNFSEVRGIHCDKWGTLWVVGQFGICFFDWAQDTFMFFQHPKLEGFITRCGDLDEDKDGNMWFTTNRGLVKYSPKSDDLILYKQEKNNPKAPENGSLDKIVVTKKNHVWYGYERDGAGYFDVEKGLFHQFYNSEETNSLGENRIERLFEDSEGNIWIGHNNNGISKYSYGTNSFTRYFPEPDRTESGRIRGIAEDLHGNMWFGSQGGLYLFNKVNESFIRYAYTDHPISTLSHNSVQTILIDDQEGLWIGTFAGGVSYANLNSSGIIKYEYSKIPSKYYLNDKNVYALAFDNNENIWIGTESGGVNYLNRSSGEFTYYVFDPGNINTPRSNNIKEIYIDKNNLVWIGTYKGGMSVFNPESKQFKHFIKSVEFPGGIDDETIFNITPDPVDENLLWIGTTNKLYTFNKTSKNFTQITSGNDEFINTPEIKRVFSTCYTSDKKIIFGSNKLIILDRITNQFELIQSVNGIEIKQMDFVLVDKHGYLWAAINSAFIVRYDIKNKQFVVFDKARGLPEIDYLEGAADPEGDLWLSTNRGIWKLENIVEDTGHFKIVHYDKSANVQSLEFVYHSKAVSSSGEILFGGINGFNSFLPEKVKPNPYVPNVIVTKLSVSGHEVRVNEKVEGRILLKKPIMETHKLRFHHRIKVFTFYFAGLHYVAPENNQFKYKLEGYDKDWQYTGANVRMVTYSNIPAGNYVFKVDASNNNGKWSEKPFTIEVTVRPPLWKTIWFWLFIIVVVGTIVYVFIQIREKELIHDKEILENELQKGKEEIERSKEEIKKQHLALEEKEKQERIQKWQNEGLAKFSEIITREKNDVQKFSYIIVSNLVKYLDVQQGGIFLENKDLDGRVQLELSGSYAFNADMLEKKVINEGEGQIGTCYKNRKMIQIDELPDSYIKLTSGLGESVMRHLILLPIMKDELIVGVLELASFKKVEEYKIQFINKINENIVSIIASVKSNQIIQEMLRKSKEQAEILMSQEEEMRQNLEEMQATQEEANRREQELKAELEKCREKRK